jgi:hypothetical protein
LQHIKLSISPAIDQLHLDVVEISTIEFTLNHIVIAIIVGKINHEVVALLEHNVRIESSIID